MFGFELQGTDGGGAVRRGRLTTWHGSLDTPAFMPVGSLGTVKGLGPEDVQRLGFGLILNNAYHLSLRPGHEVVSSLGGLHAFTGWPGAILTDSGGFQVFSLAKLRKVSEDGVTFQSHIDGSLHHLSPERSIEIQEHLGADIIMAFDECVALPAPPEAVRQAMERTSRWARRCLSAKRRPDQALFGIVQGGADTACRMASAQDLVSLSFDGYAVGGLSVGEEKSVMHRVLDTVVPVLPADRPRYLMGAGMPEDLVEGVARGIDMFDCVVPTRHGRTGWLFTSFGRVLIKQAQYARDERPIDPACSCEVCRRFSRAYLHHLFLSKEMLGVRLNTLHNLAFFSDLMRRIRLAIETGTFARFRREFYAAREVVGVSSSGDHAAAAEQELVLPLEES